MGGGYENDTYYNKFILDNSNVRLTNSIDIPTNSIDISLPGLKLFSQCPSGLPCDPVTQPPNNNLLQWETPYA